VVVAAQPPDLYTCASAYCVKHSGLAIDDPTSTGANARGLPGPIAVGQSPSGHARRRVRH